MRVKNLYYLKLTKQKKLFLSRVKKETLKENIDENNLKNVYSVIMKPKEI